MKKKIIAALITAAVTGAGALCRWALLTIVKHDAQIAVINTTLGLPQQLAEKKKAPAPERATPVLSFPVIPVPNLGGKK